MPEKTLTQLIKEMNITPTQMSLLEQEIKKQMLQIFGHSPDDEEHDDQGNDIDFLFPELLKFLMFSRCNRLNNEMAQFPVNSNERRKLQDEYAPILGFTNQAQIKQEELFKKYVNFVSTFADDVLREMFVDDLTDMQLPLADSPIYTVVDGDIVPLTVETVAEWLIDELQRQKEPDVVL